MVPLAWTAGLYPVWVVAGLVCRNPALQILGSAVGNLVDRVFREPGFLRGGVVDFISVFAPDGEVYPVFNVADSAIVCGGVLGVVLALRGIEFDGTRGGRGADDDAPARD